MNIKLNSRHKSIAVLETEDLPGFTILIGRNGAGKTQILEALSEGRAVIAGIGRDEIERYDMASFLPPNVSRADRQVNQFAQATADAYLSPVGGQPPIETAAAIFNQFVNDIGSDSGSRARDDFECNLRDEIRRLPDFAIFAADAQDPSYKKTLYPQVLAPLNRENTGRQGRRSSDQPKNRFNGNQATLLSAAMKLSVKLPHELTRGDIMRASHCEGHTMANSISEVFATYKLDQFISAHKRIEREHVPFDELLSEYRVENPPPWETLRAILSDMRDAAGDDGLFNFDFSDPEDSDLRVENYDQFTFASVMTNRTTGAQYALDSLSSGEKILMTLCLVSFNQYFGRRRPKLLLLDELDALLHPSMVAAMFKTLKTLFVSQGTKVLMTSHSPMTVAALDEDGIFRVVRTGSSVNVTRTTKSEAISELSEGLATVDVGLRIAAYDEARVTILTEGHNTKHLKRWVELNFPEDVEVFDELEQHTNDKQLLAYGRLLGKMNTNTHFVIVWDCDAAGKVTTLSNELPDTAEVTPFAFPKRLDNKIAERGIENNYDQDILEPYVITTKRSDGTLVSQGFQNDRKTEFADHVLRHGTARYFTNYESLRELVSKILGSSEQA